MAKHVWAVLCRRAIVDQTINSASLIDTIEEITVEPSKPLLIENWLPLPMEAVIAVLLSRSDRAIPERCNLRMDLSGPNGETFDQEGPTVVEIDLTATVRSRTMINLKTIPVRGSGEHKFVLRLEDPSGAWREVAELPLDINIKQPLATEVSVQTTPSEVSQQRGSRGEKRRRRPKT